MSLYGYYKSPIKYSFKESKDKTSRRKALSLIFSILGMVLVGNAVIPLINFQLQYSNRFSGKMLSPISNHRTQTLGAISASAQEEDKDYTLISSWFEEPVNLAADNNPNITDYRISIPALGLENAWVQIGGEDLKKKLIHYPDTALPGQLGNAVIFGHSVLPQFYNPKNYLTIFSTLYTLEQGSKIKINYDGIIYEYLVEKMFEVSPSDVSVLEQRYDGRYLTLITCSPPGTYIKRLIVRARLVY